MRKTILILIPVSILLFSSILVLADGYHFGYETDETQFWNKVNQNTEWILEYNHSGLWVDATEHLNIITDYDIYECKISLEFTAPKAGDYKLTFLINKKAKEYLYKESNHIYFLNYTWENIDYSLYFNFTDIANIPNIEMEHGLNGDYFYFSATKRNVPKDKYVYLDPQFGSSGGTFGFVNIENDLYTQSIQNIHPSTGQAQYIRVRLNDVVQDGKIKCALYDGSTGDFIAETNEFTFRANSNILTWYYLYFDTVVDINGFGTRYGLAVMSDSVAKIAFIITTPSTDATFWDLGINYPPSFPDPMTFDGFSIGYYFGIQLYYVNNGTIKHTNFETSIGLFNISLDYITSCNMTINLDVNHTFGEVIDMDTNIYYNGQYILSELGHGNTTLSFQLFDYIGSLDVGIHNVTYNTTDEDDNYLNTTFWFNISEDDLNIMGTISFNESQFGLILLIVIWSFLYYMAERENSYGIALAQTAFMIPVVLSFSIDAYIHGLTLGIVVIFGIILASVVQVVNKSKPQK